MNYLHVLTVLMVRQALCLQVLTPIVSNPKSLTANASTPISSKFSTPISSKFSTPRILTLDLELRNLSELPEVISLESRSRPLSAVSRDLYSYASGSAYHSKIQYVYSLACTNTWYTNSQMIRKTDIQKICAFSACFPNN